MVLDYTANLSDELNLETGDIVTGIRKEDGGWWEGEVNGKRGMFPENVVAAISKIQSTAEPKNVNLTKTTTEKSKRKNKLARVLFEFEQEEEDELELSVGDVVEVLWDEDDGWWKGRLNGHEGLFPSNYVEMIDDEPQETSIQESLNTTGEERFLKVKDFRELAVFVQCCT